MDDKLKRELSAAVDRGADDPSTQKLISRDAQARAYFDGLLAVDRALRAWPAPEAAPAERDSDAFVDAVLARLDQPMSDDFDPFAVPFADEREAQKTPRKHSEQHAMSQSNDQDNEDDLEGLAALMRPSRTGSSASVPPPPVSVRPGPALTDDAMDESSGIVDIKHLAAIAKRASVPPATADETAAKSDEKKADEKKADEKKADEKKADGKKSDDKSASKVDSKKSDEKSASKADASGEKKTEKKLQAVPAATAVSEPVAEKKGTSPVVWIAGIGIAAGIAFVAGRQGNNPAATVNAEAPQSTAAAPAQSPVLSAGTGGADRGQQALAQPAAQPAAPPATPPAVADQAAAPTAEGAAPTIGGAVAAGAPSPTPTPTTVAAAAPGNSPAESESAPRRAASEPAAAARTATRETPTTGAAIEPSRPSGATSTGASRTSAPAASDTAAAPSGSSGSSARGSGASAAPATNTATPAAANTQGARPRSVEELMAAATGRTTTPTAAPTTTTASTVPPQLTRSMVQSTMSPFNSAVRACAQGQTGTATAILTVNGDGSVANAAVSSPWGSGPNDCITNRLRTARFPAVQRPSSRVVYPFAVLAPQPGG